MFIFDSYRKSVKVQIKNSNAEMGKVERLELGYKAL